MTDPSDLAAWSARLHRLVSPVSGISRIDDLLAQPGDPHPICEARCELQLPHAADRIWVFGAAATPERARAAALANAACHQAEAAAGDHALPGVSFRSACAPSLEEATALATMEVIAAEAAIAAGKRLFDQPAPAWEPPDYLFSGLRRSGLVLEMFDLAELSGVPTLAAVLRDIEEGEIKGVGFAARITVADAGFEALWLACVDRRLRQHPIPESSLTVLSPSLDARPTSLASIEVLDITTDEHKGLGIRVALAASQQVLPNEPRHRWASPASDRDHRLETRAELHGVHVAVEDPAEVFHEASMYDRAVDHQGPGAHYLKPRRNRPARLLRPGYRPSGPAFDLPEPKWLGARLTETLTARISARSVGTGAITTTELSTVLWSMAGEIGTADLDKPSPGRRVAPSAGQLYPLDIFVYANHVEGLPAATYHFDPPTRRLSLLKPALTTNLLSRAYFAPWLADAAVGAFLSAVFARSRFKYGLRGYRLVLLEAGHIVQNALLVATAMGVQARPVGGFFDRELNAVFDLDGLNEAIVYGLVVGRNAAPD